MSVHSSSTSRSGVLAALFVCAAGLGSSNCLSNSSGGTGSGTGTAGTGQQQGTAGVQGNAGGGGPQGGAAEEQRDDKKEVPAKRSFHGAGEGEKMSGSVAAGR